MAGTYHVMSGQIVPAANKSILGIFNPSGSGVLVRISRIWVRGYDGVTAGTGVITDFSVIRLSNLTVGTGGAVTPVAYDSTNTLSTVVCYQGGTATEIAAPNTYTRCLRGNEEQVSPLTGNSSTWWTHPQMSLALDLGYGDQVNTTTGARPIILREGQGVHIKNILNTVVNTVEAWMEFDVVASGPTSGSTWTAYAPAVTWAASGKYMFSLMNATGSGVVCYVKRIYMLNNQTTGVTGMYHKNEIRYITAHTVGTAVNITPSDTTQSALPAQVTASHASTSVVDSDIIMTQMYSGDEAAVNTATNDELETILPFNVIYDCYGDAGVQPLTLRVGEGIAIKGAYTSGTAAGNVDIFCEFVTV